MPVTEAPKASMEDYHVTMSAAQLKAVQEVLRKADGRKNETKLARKAFGMQ